MQKLFEDKPIYKYNDRHYQIGEYGVVFDITAIQPDPYLEGYQDITGAICNVTGEIESAVKKIANAENCKHQPDRQYSWVTDDGTLCVGCCDCGESWTKPLRGAK